MISSHEVLRRRKDHGELTVRRVPVQGMGAGRGSTSNAISEAERFRAGSGYELGYKFATGRASCNARAVKIAFINSSAEPGRDGMGDYSLSLAAALRSLGHSVLVVGLTDRWVTTVFTDANSDGVELERIPSSLSLGERIDTACMRLKTFRPDWMSFQMSCYAHHRKGILCGFNRHLPRLVATCENWQVMVQELWVGFHVGAPWKHRLVGAVQKYGIQRALRILRPKLLQTSTPLFQAFLRTLGMEASVLPLAGSIPVDPDPGEGWFLEMLGEEGSPVAAEERSGHLVGGFFGAIYPGWESEGFFPSLRKVAEKTGRKVTIFAAGRMGAVGEAIWNRLATEHPGIRFRKLGELPFVRVSHYLKPRFRHCRHHLVSHRKKQCDRRHARSRHSGAGPGDGLPASPDAPARTTCRSAFDPCGTGFLRAIHRRLASAFAQTHVVRFGGGIRAAIGGGPLSTTAG